MKKPLTTEAAEIRKIVVAGRFTLLAALIGVSGVLINGYWDHRKPPAVPPTSQSSPPEASAITTADPHKKKRPAHISTSKTINITIEDSATGIPLDKVDYSVSGIRGKSDSNGIIEIPVSRLNPKTSQDMFLISLTRHNYKRVQVYIAVQDDVTLKLVKNENF